MALHIRRGVAHDAEFLAEVMLSASRAQLERGLWDLIIGADEPGCLDYLRRLALAQPRTLYHYESFLIAEVDGERAAALCGFETSGAWERVGEAMAGIERDLNWTEEDRAASHERVAPIWANCTLTDIGADFAIESVATLPEYRRRGLISALIYDMLRDATGRGCRLAQISTYLGNNPALAAYEKNGFAVRDEKHCAEVQRILGVPGFVRLTRVLKID
jgi:GNAT superfamily N-acetyltransferase